MEIKIVSKNFEVTTQLKDYLEKRLSKFEKMMGTLDDVNVKFSSQKFNQRVEVTIYLPEVILRGEDQGPDAFACIDNIVEKIESQVRKHKTKLEKRMKDGGAQREIIIEAGEELNNYTLVKRKTYSLKPFTVEEAIMQMDLLGHDFFVFVNADTMETNVLYRRLEGNYALLEPEA